MGVHIREMAARDRVNKISVALAFGTLYFSASTFRDDFLDPLTLNVERSSLSSFLGSNPTSSPQLEPGITSAPTMHTCCRVQFLFEPPASLISTFSAV